MLKSRVIPCLDVNDGRVVKGVKFQNLRDAGVRSSFRFIMRNRAPTNWCCWTSPRLGKNESRCWKRLIKSASV